MNKKQKNFNLTSPTGVDVFLMAILILIAILTLLPFYQVLLLSFSDVVSYAEHPVYLWLYTAQLNQVVTDLLEGAVKDAEIKPKGN